MMIYIEGWEECKQASKQASKQATECNEKRTGLGVYEPSGKWSVYPSEVTDSSWS